MTEKQMNVNKFLFVTLEIEIFKLILSNILIQEFISKIQKQYFYKNYLLFIC